MAFLFTEIDFLISVYQKDKPRGSANFRPGSNPSHEGAIPMTQADRVYSTPPTNTPISQINPVDAPSRRRFLSHAAGVAAGGTVLKWNRREREYRRSTVMETWRAVTGAEDDFREAQMAV